jgi:protein MpaA
MEIIDTFTPDKIISLHSPLNFVDYDGPGDRRPNAYLSAAERRAKAIGQVLAATSKRMKFVDYPFFPGSLGNYAGNERNIPTITVELSSSHHRYAQILWQSLAKPLRTSVEFEFHRVSLATSDSQKVKK